MWLSIDRAHRKAAVQLNRTRKELKCFYRNTCLHFAESRQIPNNTEINLHDLKLAMVSNLESFNVWKTLPPVLCIFFAPFVGNTSPPSKKRNSALYWTLYSNCHIQHCLCGEEIIGLHRTLLHIDFSLNKYVTTTFYKMLCLFCKQWEETSYVLAQ